MLFPPESEQPGQQQPERVCRTCGARVDPTYRYCPNCGTPSAGVIRSCPNCGAPIGGDYRFCIRCGSDISATSGLEWQPAFSKYPVRFDVQYPGKLSRLSTLFRLILVVPQLLIAYALSTVAGVITIIAWFAILFTGRYPPGLFNMVVGFNRWTANVYAYLALLRDEYPPFSMDPGHYPVVYEVDYPARLSRLLIFVKWILVFVHQFLIWVLTSIAVLLLVISWFAILITGRYPRAFFDFNSGLMRWYLRVGAYTALLRDEFPPYSTKADAPAGGRASVVVGAILGLIGWSLYIGAIVAFSSFSPHTETVVVRYAGVLAGEPTAPVSIDGTEVILLRGVDPVDFIEEPRRPRENYRYVSYDLSVTNRDASFTSIDSRAFRLEDASGSGYSPQSVRRLTYPPSSLVKKGEKVRVRVLFEVRERERIESLTYSPGFAAYTPFGDRVRFEFR